MSFGRYELFVDGEKAGDHETIQDVFDIIDSHYDALRDQYDGVVRWEIEDWGPDADSQLRITRKNMPAALWFAFAETAETFEKYLDLFCWNERPTPSPRNP